METKKQEAIRLAWGNLFEKYKDRIDEYGYITFTSNWWAEFLELKSNTDFEMCEEAFGQTSFRPKSLSGIEDNNGWITVDSEDELPTELELYEFIPCGRFDEKFIGWIDLKLREVFFTDFKKYKIQKGEGIYLANTNAWLTSQITHYRPIKSQNPIH